MTIQTQELAVHVLGLEGSYKQLYVLRGVDFDVARGSIFALLGSHVSDITIQPFLIHLWPWRKGEP
jgi:ABC-type transporter Mla maintaining outer membrane lipid asymmetry ATPase subunit MlaF